jgi:aldehyde:ferredoxin oxidoreductase
MDFVACRGFGIKYLSDELAPEADPLGEENKLILSTGVLTGTQSQSVSRGWPVRRDPSPGATPGRVAVVISGPG